MEEKDEKKAKRRAKGEQVSDSEGDDSKKTKGKFEKKPNKYERFAILETVDLV